MSRAIKKNADSAISSSGAPDRGAVSTDELVVLYGAAEAEETFLLDFFIGSMARDHEAYGKHGDPDLTGTPLTLYGKHHKTRAHQIKSLIRGGERRTKSFNRI